MSGLRRMLRKAETWIFPECVGCMICDRALTPENREGLCTACIALLEEQAMEQAAFEREEERPAAEGLAYVHAAYPYDGAARQLILKFKYSGMRKAALTLANAMAELPIEHEEIVVPVPTTQERLRERGFNQAMLLAEIVAARKGLPCVQALTRTDSHAAQMTLSAREREKNVSGCMRADGSVRGKRILLIDDVYTTGSTAREAARALHEAGAEHVGMLAASRTIRQPKTLPEFLRGFAALAKKLRQNTGNSDKVHGKL